MKIKFLILAFIVTAVVAFSGNLYAENGNENHAEETFSYAGKVIDQNTGEALAGVKILVEDTQQTFYSDLDGNFLISGLRSGIYEVKATFISYEEKEIVLNTASGKSNEMEIALKNL